MLIAEDDSLLGDGLKTVLHQRGHTVDWVQDGMAANHALQREHYDLAVVDLNLPILSGEELVARLRADNNPIPILILTARAQLNDRVKLFNAGADDYVIKPFEIDELNARINALHRRNSGHASPQLQVGNILLDPNAHTVSADGRQIRLSNKEFNILRQLMENSGRVISRSKLEEGLYGWGGEIESNAVEVHIHHLRKKLKSNPIRTIRGIGYIID